MGGLEGPFLSILYDAPYVSFEKIPPPPELPAYKAGLLKAATITVNYLPAGPGSESDNCIEWPAAAKAAFGHAATIWASKLVSTVPIRIDACWSNNMRSDILGHAGPTSAPSGFANSIPNTHYPIALANTLAGSDLNGAAAEIYAAFNSTFGWYFGTDQATPATQKDFVSVVLHEIGHGLGFVGGMSVSGGSGTWGAVPQVYDRFTQSAAGQALINTGVFPNPSAALATQLQSNAVYFQGPNASAANGGTRVALYAPATWVQGSSYSHLAESYNATIDALMTYSLPNGESLHSPGPVTIGLMRDLGWTFTADAAPPILTVVKQGTGGGIIQSSPNGIDCGLTCSGSFVPGSLVTLWVYPDAGSTFIGWGGSCKPSATIGITLPSPCEVRMTGPETATASFINGNLTNGDFESGGYAWTQLASPAAPSRSLIVSDAANSRTGSRHALLDETGDVLYQDFIIPPSATTARLRFWYRVSTTEVGNDAYDRLHVSIIDPFTGTSLQPLLALSNLDAGSGYAQSETFDLTLYKGRAIRLQFRTSTTDSILPTAFRIDDINFDNAPILTVNKGGTGDGTVTSAPAGIHCGATCSVVAAQGSTYVFTATPAPGSVFSGWSGAGCSGGTCTVVASNPETITATFDRPKFTLTLNYQGTGPRGSVVSVPPGISCGGNQTSCSASFDAGTTVVLTAASTSFSFDTREVSDFMGWNGGGCFGTGSCTVTMDAAKIVGAIYDRTNALQVVTGGTGTGVVTSSSGDIVCPPDCTGSFVRLTALTLTATPAAGSTFTGWSGPCTGTGQCRVTMGDSGMTLTATFGGASISKNALTATKHGQGSGTVSSSPAGIDCGATCVASYANGTAVTMTAVAAAGSTFTGWIDNGSGCSGTAPCTVSLGTSKAVAAGFAPAGAAFASGDFEGSVSAWSQFTSPPTPGRALIVDDSTHSRGGTRHAALGAVENSYDVLHQDFVIPASATRALLRFWYRVSTAEAPGSLVYDRLIVSILDPVSQLTLAPLVTLSNQSANPAYVQTGTFDLASLRGRTVRLRFAVESDSSLPTTFRIDDISLDASVAVLVSKSGTGSGLVTSSPAGIECGATCTAGFPGGTNVTLLATAPPGSRFEGWSGGGCSGTGSCVVSLNAAAWVTATFGTATAATLSVNKNGNWTGKVTSSPAGIDCGPACVSAFHPGTHVVLTATPTPSSLMTVSPPRWSGACAGNAGTTCSIPLNASAVALVDFDAVDPYGQPVTIIKAGAGSGMVMAGTQQCPPNARSCTFYFAPGSTVHLSATAAAGSSFTGWSGPCAGGGTCTFTATGRIAVEANFSGTPGGLSVTPARLEFGGQSMQTTSAPRHVTLVNSSAGVVQISTTSMSGPFTASHNCGSLQPGAACTVSVTFTPTAQGSIYGSLSFSSNAPLAAVELAGVGERSLVTHYYGAILNRAPDAAGKAFWESEAARLSALGVNINETWFVMAGYFFNSAEYAAANKTHAQFVSDLYNTFFNRGPDADGLNYWVGQINAGLPREVVLFSFMFSSEFRTFTQGIFGSTAARPEVDMVVDFFRGLLNRLPDTNSFNYWLGQLRAAQCAGAGQVYAAVEAISAAFMFNPEYANRARNNTQFVTDMYYSFLRRGGDVGGVNYWINELNTGARYPNDVRYFGFLNSAEFGTRVQAVIAAGCAQ
ncbi:MAG TPA: DUF4214 domain-containing protein [Usitatibacter sp.]|nr:DUF4214 domain-containing protein [Usitatibacter sp.]